MVSKQVGFVVGSDIGGSNLSVAAADLFGEPICDLKQPTTKAGGRALGMQVLEMVTEVIDRASAAHGRPLALAISTPGIIDQSTGRVTSLAYNVAPEGGFDPLEVIRDRLDMPVLVENNVNLAAVGEKWFGLARGVSTMVFISVGAGIGMGIVIDDEVVRGAHGAAGEIGYLPLAGDPFDPRHRLHGGLEDEIGAAGIVAAFNERRAPADPELSAVHEVFELASAGERGGSRGRRSTWPGGSARRSQRSARSSIRSWSCSAVDRLESAAALPRARRGRLVGPDHAPHRNQPARRPGRATGSDRSRPAHRPHVVALRRRLPSRRGRSRRSRATAPRLIATSANGRIWEG